MNLKQFFAWKCIQIAIENQKESQTHRYPFDQINSYNVSNQNKFKKQRSVKTAPEQSKVDVNQL